MNRFVFEDSSNIMFDYKSKTKVEAGITPVLILVVLVSVSVVVMITAAGLEGLKDKGFFAFNTKDFSKVFSSQAGYLDDDKINKCLVEGSVVGTVNLPDGSFSAYKILEGRVDRAEAGFDDEAKITFLSGDLALGMYQDNVVVPFYLGDGTKTAGVIMDRMIAGFDYEGTTYPVKIIKGRVVDGKLSGDFVGQTYDMGYIIAGSVDGTGHIVQAHVTYGGSRSSEAESAIALNALTLFKKTASAADTKVLAAETSLGGYQVVGANKPIFDAKTGRWAFAAPVSAAGIVSTSPSQSLSNYLQTLQSSAQAGSLSNLASTNTVYQFLPTYLQPSAPIVSGLTSIKSATSNLTVTTSENTATLTLDLSGVSASVADGGISTAKIADSAVTGAKISDGTVSDSKLGTISTANKVSGSAVQLASAGGLANNSGLSLTTACTSGQILKWNGSSWACSADTGGGGGGSLDILEGGATVTSGVTALNFTASDFVSTDSSGQNNISIDYTNSKIVRSDSTDTLTNKTIAAGSNTVTGLSVSNFTSPNISQFTNNSGFITGISWGAVAGTLANQTDLQSALNAKADTSGLGTLSAQNANSVTITGGSLSGLTSVGATSISGALTGDVTGNVSGNAGTVTNGIYSTGSYANPAWITSLSASKVLPDQTGNNGKVLGTNGTSVSWVTNSSGVAWGAITGTLTDQSDLNTALGLKYDSANFVSGTNYLAPNGSAASLTNFPTFNQNTTGTSSNITGVLGATSFPAMTGDVTNTQGSLSTAIASGAVSLSKMANLAANSIIGNNTGISATPIALTASQVKTLLGISTTDVSGLGTIATQNSNNVSITGGTLSGLTSAAATTFTGALSGNATTATTLATARTIAGTSFNGSANISLSNKFIVQGTTDAGLTGAQFLGALGTGIVKNTTTTGVLSIAVAGDFPTLNQNTTGTASNITGVLGAASFPAMTGDVTNTQGNLSNAIAAGAVTLGKMANLAANSIIGNNTGISATPIALTAAQVKTLLAIANTDVSGLGTMSTQNANAVSITGGTHTGITGLGIRSSGTGAFDLTINNTENLTAGRTLTITTGNAARTLTLTGDASITGTNTGDNSANSTYASDYRAANFVAGTNYLAPNGSAASLTSFPTLNQNTTGTASNITGVLGASSFPAMTGDVTNTQGSLSTAIASGAVTLGKMANLAANSIIGNNTGISAAPIALTAAQVKTLLAIANTDVSGLGTMSTQNANGVAITGGTLSGLTSAAATTFTGALSGNATSATTATTGNALANTDAAGQSAITAINSATAGTINTARLNSSVTTQGNTFNGISQLVKLDTSGNLPALNASALTGITGDQVLPTQTGNNGKVLGTNGTTVSWVTNSSGVAWGAITGILSDQSDLNTALGGKLTTTLTSANIFVGNGTNVATGVAMSGDVTIDNTGLTVVGAGKITLAKMANMATASFLGRNTAGAGAPEVLSASTAKSILSIANTDVSGLGTMSTQNASGVAITGGTAAGLTGLGIRSSGTGAFDLTIANTENLTAGRTLTITLGNVARTLTLTGDASITGTNTGDNSANSTYASDYRAANFVAGTNYLAPNGSAASLTNFPTLNQNTTGTASNITGVLGASSFPAMTGDVTNTQGNLSNAIATGAVTLSKMANLAANSIIGNNTGISATPIALTTAQVKTLLAIANTDVSGLGTMSTQNANAVAMTGGTHTGITGLGIRSTGTGAFDLTIANTENLTAGRTLTITLGNAARTLTLTGDASITGTNTGDNSANSTYASDYRAANFVAGTNYLAPNGSAASLTSFPTLNQNTTGTASNITGVLGAASFPAMTGDVTNTQGNLSNAIATGAVTLAKMANLAANSIIGNNTGISATPIALTVAQVKTLLAIATGDVSGLGTIATQASSSVTLTGGTINGITIGGTTAGAGTFTTLTTNTSITRGTDTITDFTGNGLTLSSGALTLVTPVATDALSATTSNGSGLEVLSGGIALLQGCADGQILKWTEASDTWSCQADSGGAGSGISTVKEGASNIVTSATALNFAANDFAVTDETGGQAGIAIDYTNSHITRDNQVQTVSSAWTFGAASSVTLGTSSSNTGAVIFKNSTNANTVTLQSGVTSGNYTWTLPTADSAGCLKSDGGGTLSISTCGDVNVQTFTVTGANTWTKPSGALLVVVEAWGGGGGGGGGGSVTATTARTGGAGGGGGAYVSRTFAASDVAVGGTETVTVGVGGTSGAGGTNATGSNGGVGASTTFGANLTAYGGGGGRRGANTTTAAGGGGGGGSGAPGVVGPSATGGAGGGPGGAAAAANADGNGGAGGGTGASTPGVGGSGYWGGGGGGSTSTGSVAGGAGGGSMRGGAAGGGGGSIAASGANVAGGAGGNVPANNGASGGGGTAGTLGGGIGGSGSANTTGMGGDGGGGGGSQAVSGSNGGAGGTGGAPAGGGGGGGSGTHNGSVGSGGAGGVGGRGEARITTYRGTGADLAEIYSTNEDLAAGDVVALDPSLRAGVKKTSKAYDPTALGIISTSPSLVMGSLEDTDAKAAMVALSGRVPVKVSTENGAIKPGDLLTPSSIPGVAMKATKAGQIVGQAMIGFEGISGTDSANYGLVLAFVKNQIGNGQSLIAGLNGSDGTPSIQDSDKEILLNMVSQKDVLGASTDVSEINTDRITAGLAVITPKLLADEITVRDLSASGLKVTGPSIFLGNVEFTFVPLFNSDTAGFAVIKQGDTEVKVNFDKEYLSLPVINASPQWDTDQSTLDVMKQLGTYILPKQDYIIANSSTHGFTIVLDKPAAIDLKFSWIALSVKDAKTVFSNGVTTTPVPNTTSTPSASPSASPLASPSVTPEPASASPSATPTIEPFAFPFTTPEASSSAAPQATVLP